MGKEFGFLNFPLCDAEEYANAMEYNIKYKRTPFNPGVPSLHEPHSVFRNTVIM